MLPEVRCADQGSFIVEVRVGHRNLRHVVGIRSSHCGWHRRREDFRLRRGLKKAVVGESSRRGDGVRGAPEDVVPLSRGARDDPGTVGAARIACTSGMSHPVRLPWKRTLRRNVWRACSGHCVYCGSGLELDDFTIDHVIPASAGGATSLMNCVAACRKCNQLKADRPLHDFILQAPEVGQWFLRFARQVARAQKRVARRAVSLAFAQAA